MKPAIWLSLILLLTPALFWLHHAKPETFAERLVWPHLTTVLNRHTPRYTAGVQLPGTTSPVILTGTTRVSAGTTLIIPAGTTIYASEFATLIIDGTLITQGTPEKPVVFSTNEQHEANQLWNGLVFNAGSHGQLNNTIIEYAAPALTCLAQSTVTGSTVHLKNTKRPVFSKTGHCL